METVNVSAQVYNKQLPNANVLDYSCGDSSTCDKDTVSDANIENAFQQQLDLSNYYKGTSVFDAMKKRYIDQTIPPEGKNIPMGVSPGGRLPPILNIKPPLETSKSTFGMSKSTFGNESVIMIMIIILIFCYFYHENIVNWFKNLRNKTS